MRISQSIGSTAAAMGRYDKALADYKQTIRLNPKNASAYSGFALILATSTDAELRNT